jgi:hypothetical protein
MRSIFKDAALGTALFLVLTLAGCSNPAGSGGGTGDGGSSQLSFSVSGTFDKDDDGIEDVSFTLQSDGSQRRSAGRAVITSFTISGILEDGDFTIRLTGTYDPYTGIWSVSAKSSTIVYTLGGSVDADGNSQGTTATIAVKEDDGEWSTSVLPVTEETVNIDVEEEDLEEGDAGVPSFGQGWWRSQMVIDVGYEAEISCLISPWKLKATINTTWNGTHSTETQECNIIEINDLGDDSYDFIYTYPEYVITSEDFKNAVADFLGINKSLITVLSKSPWDIDVAGDLWPTGKWVYYNEEDESTSMGGFTDAEWTKLDSFWAQNYWELWAADNGIQEQPKYAKLKVTYRNSGTVFDMVSMVEESDDPGEPPGFYTYNFDTLAELKAATLVEAHNWNFEWDEDTSSLISEDLGVSKMTFTR